MKLKFSGQIVEKYSNMKFCENLSSASRVVPCGQTDKRDEASSRFSQFWERGKNEYHRSDSNARLSQFCHCLVESAAVAKMG